MCFYQCEFIECNVKTGVRLDNKADSDSDLKVDPTFPHLAPFDRHHFVTLWNVVPLSLKICHPSLVQTVTPTCESLSHVPAEELMDKVVTALSTHMGLKEEDVSPIGHLIPAATVKCGSFNKFKSG